MGGRLRGDGCVGCGAGDAGGGGGLGDCGGVEGAPAVVDAGFELVVAAYAEAREGDVGCGDA